METLKNTVVVDNELIELGESGIGGWNKKQLAIIGINWPPTKGWKDRVIGTVISREKANEFISLKGKPKSKSKKAKPIFVKVNKNMSLQDQYKHPNWQKLRLVIMQRDNFQCQRCGDNDSQLHVHHLRYPKNKKIWGARHADLITLCEKCHLKAHGKKTFSKRPAKKHTIK